MPATSTYYPFYHYTGKKFNINLKKAEGRKLKFSDDFYESRKSCRAPPLKFSVN